MSRFSDLGNDLYSGKRSIDFVGRLRVWMAGSVVILLAVILGVSLRGFNFGIEFTGGSDFRVAGVSDTAGYDSRARDAVAQASGVQGAAVQLVGDNTVRVQTERMSEDSVRQVTSALSSAFGVPAGNIASAVVGPSWGESVSQQAVRALIVFLALVSLVLAVYFRTWKMSFSALVALLHDIVITVGVYSLAGFEITPASAIGFLTILGYSLYDTVVVFDKVRENTAESMVTNRLTYAEASNLAVNQTLIRSVNTSVVALLPVAAVLVMGVTVIGPGTLLDLSLALFIGIAVGTYSSIFIATPLLVWLRRREPEIQELQTRVEQRRERLAAAGHPVDARGLPTNIAPAPVPVPSSAPGTAGLPVRAAQPGETLTATGRPVHPSMLVQPEDKPRRLRRRKKSS